MAEILGRYAGGNRCGGTKATICPFLFREKSLDFIERNQHSPFFLFVSLNDPHANNEAGHFLGDGMEVPDYGIYADMDWPNPEKGFAAMIQNIDETVGAIHRKLKECGIEENTLVIFISDNGPHAEGHHDPEFFNSSGPLRGKKRDLYEGGIRTPFIAKWPDKIKAGSASDHISAFWDYLPTFCEIAGIEVPVHTDGISFLPALTGNENKQQKHEYLYWEFYERGGIQAALMENWKMLKLNIRTGDPIIELYDLDQDISEQNNLAHLHPDIVSKIDSMMMKAHAPLPFISLFDDQINADTPF
jgi:arylsulfatase A-like enzyme